MDLDAFGRGEDLLRHDLGGRDSCLYHVGAEEWQPPLEHLLAVHRPPLVLARLRRVPQLLASDVHRRNVVGVDILGQEKLLDVHVMSAPLRVVVMRYAQTKLHYICSFIL